jgi:hypothetical protein
MKPRRENGATFVSPMTSDVSWGSAFMAGFLSSVGRRIQQTNAAERKSPACEDRNRVPNGCNSRPKNKAVSAV